MAIQAEEINNSPVSLDQARRLVQRAIDLHVHGPDKIPRKYNDEATNLLNQVGKIQAVVLKSHFRKDMIALAQRLTEKSAAKLQVYGSVTLNGGFNESEVLETVRSAQGQPVIIWGPTLAAKSFLDQTGSDYVVPISWVKGSKFPSIAKTTITPVACLDQNGQVRPEVTAVLRGLQGKTAIVASGHLNPKETMALAVEAHKHNIPFIATHALLGRRSPLSPKQLQQLVELGSYLEFCYIFLRDEDFDFKYNRQQIVAQIKRYLAKVIISSDCGQSHNPGPAACLRECVRVLANYGLTLDEMRVAMIENPQRLLEIAAAKRKKN